MFGEDIRPDDDRVITLGDLRERLKLDLQFTGGSWGDRENSLTVRLMFGGEALDEVSVYIEPAGFVRED